MPLTAKGRKIKAAMRKQYGSEKGTSVFYASKNAGRIKGVDKKPHTSGRHFFLGAVRDALKAGKSTRDALSDALARVASERRRCS